MTSITPSTADPSRSHPAGDFYDHWTELFLAGAGPILQAGILRTGDPPVEDPERSVIELARRAGIRDDARILDAGCGVGGPAMAIATRYPGVKIEGVTVSTAQAAIAHRRIRQAGLHRRVRVLVADYQRLPLQSECFDHVLYFESTGYATDLDAACSEAFRVLEPGGGLYVKDVFRRSGPLSASEEAAMLAFDQLWGCDRSKTMHETTEALHRAGFEVDMADVMHDIGTARLLGAMFRFDLESGVRQSGLGDAFWRRDLDPPIEFGEIRAVKPHR